MEIERKYLISALPPSLSGFPFRQIEQGYLSTEPVVRVRRDREEYYLTYKSKGLLSREEYNLPLTEESYRHLIGKADGNVLTKKRYLIPLEEQGLTVELDLFEGAFSGLVLAEVEFDTEEQAMSFQAPAWFGREVTFSGEYQNSRLSRMDETAIAALLQTCTL